MKRIKELNEISMDNPEGILALKLLARLITTVDTDKTPDEVIKLVSGLIGDDDSNEKFE